MQVTKLFGEKEYGGDKAALRERIIKLSCDDFPVRDKNPYLRHGNATKQISNGRGQSLEKEL